MRTYKFLFILVLTTLACKSVSESPGPISKVIARLSLNTVEVTERIYQQLRTKFERTANNIRGDMEVIIADAMDRLSAPIFEANNRITSSNCSQTWSMPELMQRIDLQLSTCTEDLSRILESFERDAASIGGAVQTYLRDITNLPEVCLNLSGTEQSFSGITICFVQKIADINRHIGEELFRASMTDLRARQQSKSSGTDAELCTTRAVGEVRNLLDQTLANC